MTWSPAQYTKFEAERTRPVRDLVAQLPDSAVGTAVDLGCGPGNSTEVLHARFPGADVSGLDSSADMVAAAQQRLPGLRFAVADITQWSTGSGRVDVVLANAALQWVPDHAALLPALLHRLAPGGRLAVQVPDNLDQPAHRLMREVAANGPWAAKLARAADARGSGHSADWYYRTLTRAGATVDIWRTTYHHLIADGPAGVVEWFQGTGLRPFIQPLNEAERAEYLRRYQDALAGAYPALPDGAVLLPFPRLFFIATGGVSRSSPNIDAVRQ